LSNKGYKFISFTTKADGLLTPEGNVHSESDVFEKLKELDVPKVFFCNYPRRLKCDWSDMNGVILHGGPVPEYRGASVINWQILNGESSIKLSALKFSAKFDCGAILTTRELAVDFLSLDIIRDAINKLFGEMVLEIIEFNSEQMLGREQSGPARYWHKRSPYHMQVNPILHSVNDVINLFRSSEASYRPYIETPTEKNYITEIVGQSDLDICGEPGHLFVLEGRKYLVLRDGALEIKTTRFD
jgi:methionyl-tRNA formyltransferase